MRALVPADSLIYLETNDLAAALQPIIDNEVFVKAAKSKPDFSGLKGVQLAVTVSGFEMTEEKLTDEHSVGRVQPRFVAIADTHAWNWGAVAFAESQIGAFVMDIYRSDVAQERVEKHGGTFFTWAANDGRKAFALVLGSVVYFGNDESAIEKCLAVKRGEGDSIAKTGKVQSSNPATLASGYVSTDGIAQMANIIGLKLASETGVDSEAQSAIADILPRVVRSMVTEIHWTMSKTENGIEDIYSVSMPSDFADVLSETIIGKDKFDVLISPRFLSESLSVTAYNLRQPQVAWRSLLLLVGRHADPLTGRIISEFSGSLFEPYLIGNVEWLLSEINSTIITAVVDNDLKPIVVARIKDRTIVKRSIREDLHIRKLKGESSKYESLMTEDGGAEATFAGDVLILGPSIPELEHLIYQTNSLGDEQDVVLKELFDPKYPIITKGFDLESAGQIAALLSEKKEDSSYSRSSYVTKTRFTRTGMERRTISDFGLIGSILANLSSEN